MMSVYSTTIAVLFAVFVWYVKCDEKTGEDVRYCVVIYLSCNIYVCVYILCYTCMCVLIIITNYSIISTNLYFYLFLCVLLFFPVKIECSFIAIVLMIQQY